jgi:glycosyltransferase involved in cell wall biosynthesis
MKRILFIVHSLNTGGLERMVVELANALDPDRYLPFICCVATAGDLAPQFGRPENLIVLGNVGRVNARSCAGVYRLIGRHRIDLVHSHNMAGLLYGFAAAKLRRVPIIHTNHGFAPPDSDNRMLVLAERWMSRRVDRYVCVSEALKRTVTARFRLGRNAVTVVYNGVRMPRDLGRSGAPHSGQVAVGSVGRLNAIKNYPLLLESFADVIRRFPRSRLELIGDGPEYGHLVALRNRLSLWGNVDFSGSTPDVRGRLDAIDIFVLPSLSEGLSMSILEALSMGKVCVVSNVGGNAEIIEHGVNGFLFESNNRSALTETLSHVIADIESPTLERVRTNAIETVRTKFSLAAMAAAYSTIYEETTPGHSVSGTHPSAD